MNWGLLSVPCCLVGVNVSLSKVIVPQETAGPFLVTEAYCKVISNHIITAKTSLERPKIGTLTLDGLKSDFTLTKVPL